MQDCVGDALKEKKYVRKNALDKDLLDGDAAPANISPFPGPKLLTAILHMQLTSHSAGCSVWKELQILMRWRHSLCQDACHLCLMAHHRIVSAQLSELSALIRQCATQSCNSKRISKSWWQALPRSCLRNATIIGRSSETFRVK